MCCGNASSGLPNSVSLYIENYVPSIGTLSFAGELDSTDIYFEISGNHISNNDAPKFEEATCLKGVIADGKCILKEN